MAVLWDPKLKLCFSSDPIERLSYIPTLLGFKLGRSPHLLLLVTEETNGDWAAIMAVRGALPKVARITITLDDYEDNIEFEENEISIQVTGLKAVTCNYAQIQAATMKALQGTIQKIVQALSEKMQQHAGQRKLRIREEWT